MNIKLFNNFQVYRLVHPMLELLDPQLLAERLFDWQARACGPMELSTYGFIPPISEKKLDLTVDALVESVGIGRLYLAAQKEERLLPTHVIKSELRKKIDQIENDERRKVYKKERDQLKDEIVCKLLPRAFTKTTVTRALVLGDYIVIDQASPRKCEDFLSTLREAIGSLPVRPLMTKNSPVRAMTYWARTNDMPHGFVRGETFKSRATSAESSTLSGSGVDLSESAIADALSADREVVELQLHYGSEEMGADILFSLTEDLVFKGVQWPEEMAEQISDELGEESEVDEINQATVRMLRHEIGELVGATIGALDGLEGEVAESQDDESEDLL